MGVILHRLADDVRHFVVLAVIHRLHRMKNTALNRLQTVLNRRDGSLKNDIRGIVQKPVLVHARQVIFDSVAEVSHEGLIDAFVDNDVRKNTNKLKHQTAHEQYVTWSAEVVNTQAYYSAKEDNQSEVFE